MMFVSYFPFSGSLNDEKFKVFKLPSMEKDNASERDLHVRIILLFFDNNVSTQILISMVMNKFTSENMFSES